MTSHRGRYNFDMGHTYGEISINDNDAVTALSSAALVQITDFNTTGEFHNVCACGDEDHLVIYTDGVYLVQYFLSAANDAAQSHLLSVSAYTNNGTVELVKTHAHHALTGGSGDTVHLGAGSMVALNSGETVELWAITDSEDARNVIFEDVILHVLRMGPL